VEEVVKAELRFQTRRCWPTGIGRARIYEPGIGPTIYPGESAAAEPIDIDGVIARAVDDGLDRVALPLRWHVHPTPGWRAWWLRVHHRLFWWLAGGEPELVLTSDIAAKETVH
jgi:hypothetical protein